jgi:hypothetical protein
MPSYRVNIGEAVHNGRRFRPKGKLYTYEEPVLENPLQREGGGGLAARFFVGLNVGKKKAYSIDDIVAIVTRVRRKQGHQADASILAQKGLYEDKKGRLIVEQSVQVILIDFSGATKETFKAEMGELGEELRIKLRQEKVILEIQRRGITQDVYSIVPEKKR